MFVSLSSVMVFRIVKLVILQTIVTLVFCGMSEYVHPCSTISAALRTHGRFQLSTPLCNATPDVTRQISSSPVACSESFQLSLDHKLFIRQAVCSRSLPLRWSWLQPSALFVVELCPCPKQPPSRFVSTAASLLFRFHGVLRCNRPGIFSGLQLLNCLLYLLLCTSSVAFLAIFSHRCDSLRLCVDVVFTFVASVAVDTSSIMDVFLYPSRASQSRAFCGVFESQVSCFSMPRISCLWPCRSPSSSSRSHCGNRCLAGGASGASGASGRVSLLQPSELR